MLIPPPVRNRTDRNDRQILFRNLLRECGASRDQRAGAYRTWRTAYLTGTTLGQRARYNKIKEYVQEAAADLYAPESVRFVPSLSQRYGDDFLAELDVVRDDFHDLWSLSGADMTASQLVEWAYVYPTTVAKVIALRNQPALVYVDPSDIGVWQEEEDQWGRQEAICHWYTMSVPAYARMIRRAVPDKDRAEWLIRVGAEHAEQLGNRVGDALPPGLSVILSQSTPTMTGVVPGLPDVTAPLNPMTIEPVVRLAELWVWDDQALVSSCKECGEGHLGLPAEIETMIYGHEFVPGMKFGEWLIVRVHLPTEEVLYESLNSVNPGEHAFFPLSLDPVPGYAWGNCPMDCLLALQDWHEDWLQQLRDIFNLNAQPPLAGIGLTGINDERMKILRSPGGNLPIPNQGASITPMAPPMPPDGVAWLSEISRMFARMGGRPAQMSSQFDASSRTGEQDLVRAMLGAGPTLTKAMRVESWLAKIATAMERLRRRVLAEPLKIPGSLDNPAGRRFYLAQIPSDIHVKVAAHSHSPVFQQQLLPKIAFAAQAGWIGARGGLRLLNLPLSDELQAEARQMAEIAAKRGEEIQRNKNIDAAAKATSAAAKMVQAKTP